LSEIRNRNRARRTLTKSEPSQESRVNRRAHA